MPLSAALHAPVLQPSANESVVGCTLVPLDEYASIIGEGPRGGQEFLLVGFNWAGL